MKPVVAALACLISMKAMALDSEAYLKASPTFQFRHAILMEKPVGSEKPPIARIFVETAKDRLESGRYYWSEAGEESDSRKTGCFLETSDPFHAQKFMIQGSKSGAAETWSLRWIGQHEKEEGSNLPLSGSYYRDSFALISMSNKGRTVLNLSCRNRCVETDQGTKSCDDRLPNDTFDALLALGVF